jgi:hypothetical protein
VKRTSPLRQCLLDWFRGAAAPDLEEVALEVLRYQAAANPAYGNLLAQRGLRVEKLKDWREFPPIPTRAFKELPPVAGVGDPEAVFWTSGTTRGSEFRGEHRILDLELYEASLLAQARRHLLPDRARIRVHSLLPAPQAQPHSSLIHMAGVLHRAWDDGQGAFFADSDWALDVPGIAEALCRAQAEEVPILLISTAFGLVQWLEGIPAKVQLPVGSRVMETGGFKGRTQVVPRGELYAQVSSVLGIPKDHIVNEYGMTELLSQFYEPVLEERGPANPELRRLVGPPWVRTRILNPVDLSPVPSGHPGLLCHLDLANLYSAALILTEDLGVAVEGGFRVLGRAPGAEPRGCSLSFEAYRAAGGVR